jgi:hypothetical protein
MELADCFTVRKFIHCPAHVVSNVIDLHVFAPESLSFWQNHLINQKPESQHAR